MTINSEPQDSESTSKRSREQVYLLLKQRIVAGRFAPGEQLKEEPLARQLGVSRTPVRAALQRLVEDGLATADARQGVHVTVWSDRDIEETFHLRMLLEPYAACLAAERGGEPLSAHLREANALMGAAIARGDIDEVQRANQSFHLALIRYCGSARLRLILEDMVDVPILVRSFYLLDHGELQQSLRHHEEVTVAVEHADGETARQAMALHLRTSFRRFLQRRSERQAEPDA